MLNPSPGTRSGKAEKRTGFPMFSVTMREKRDPLQTRPEFPVHMFCKDTIFYEMDLRPKVQYASSFLKNDLGKLKISDILKVVKRPYVINIFFSGNLRSFSRTSQKKSF